MATSKNTRPRGACKITELVAEHAKPAAKKYDIPDKIVTGYHLRVGKSGTKSHIVKYRPKGSKITKTLTFSGRWPTISIKDGRDLARAALLEVAKGGDPAAEKKRAERGEDDRIENVVAEYIKRVVRPNQPRSAPQTESRLEQRVVARWRGRRVHEITKADVHRVIDAIVDAGHTRTANKAFGDLQRLFAWIGERYDLERNPMVGLRKPVKERSRDRVLEDDELCAIWHAADKLGWPWGPYVRLLILTAQRRSQVAMMRWQDVDLDKAVWRLPADQMKSQRAHVVPLSEPALDILRQAPRLAGDDHVFWTGTVGGLTGYTHPKRAIDKISGVTGWRFHDLRRSAATGMAQLAIHPHVIGEVLAHAPARAMGVTSIYVRATFEPEKRKALDRWAQHVLDLAESQDAKVVPLKPA